MGSWWDHCNVTSYFINLDLSKMQWSLASLREARPGRCMQPRILDLKFMLQSCYSTANAMADSTMSTCVLTSPPLPARARACVHAHARMHHACRPDLRPFVFHDLCACSSRVHRTYIRIIARVQRGQDVNLKSRGPASLHHQRRLT